MALKNSTIIHKGSDKPKAPKNRHYVDNDELYNALVERRKIVKEAEEAGEDKPRVSEYLGGALYKIADNLSRKGNFANYSYRDEMVQDAVLVCIRYIDKFDPEKSTNPFSYFTQTCTYSFISRIHAEKKQTYVKFKATVESATMGELAVNENHSEDASQVMDNIDVTNEFMEDFINEYENKQAEKKKEAAKKRGVEKYLDED